MESLRSDRKETVANRESPEKQETLGKYEKCENRGRCANPERFATRGRCGSPGKCATLGRCETLEKYVNPESYGNLEILATRLIESTQSEGDRRRLLCCARGRGTEIGIEMRGETKRRHSMTADTHCYSLLWTTLDRALSK